ncbi:MAG: hypothetical protein AB1689_29640 [Thermodesulfobacteriota bacterium]
MFLDFYKSDVQATYLLWIVPLAFLLHLFLTRRGWRAADVSRHADSRFVRAYALVFAVETILDSFATGPLARWLGIAGTRAGTALMIAFVLIGDFRVLLLLQRLSRPALRPLQLAAESALWTLPVPLIAVVADNVLQAAAGPWPEQSIWVVYELAFFLFALFLRQVLLPDWLEATSGPRLAYLQAVTSYVAVYYALWAIADVMILVLGLDLGWLVRVVPNQLYYAFFVPFVYFRFFWSRDQASTSTSTHASR